ncbi:DegT/DnrJ/EryC1/StrS family aminotransferase [Glaciecola sp. XM2]|jgi:threonine aldolase|uniref:threonine aldolase family protein n=1 Tax=Glaciecola sp. XM2 TaxID=1914931 RepID=UPI001BDF180B|nr:beta-eliminating lyase-related protein [Glaciecola sp. XM2]MBT1449310.1 DegT/DnrJ/EryC1/StrS family aminotransferase [Glaciecola sp. XM2]
MHETLIQTYRQYAELCQTNVFGHRRVSPKQILQQLADSVTDDELSDQYGKGVLIERFEQEVAALLGKQSALFLPSGTMAQNIALKIWADEQQSDRVALHPTSHLLLHEENAVEALYQLKPVIVGQADQLPHLDEIKAATEVPLAAVLLELPMREIGGQLPTWEALVSQSEWLHAQNIPFHMDGARLWQCPEAYNKSLQQICALFDSIYVSFYKDLGGISGACLLGSHAFIEKARVWQRRAGGNLFALYPYVVAAREGLKMHLPQMRQRRDDALWLAGQFNQLSGISTWPHTPHSSMFHIVINAEASAFLKRSIDWMQGNGICLIRTPYKVNKNRLISEISIGDAFAKLPRAKWQETIVDFAKVVLEA